MAYSDFVCAVYIALRAIDSQNVMLSRDTMADIGAAFDRGETVSQCVRTVAPMAAPVTLH